MDNHLKITQYCCTFIDIWHKTMPLSCIAQQSSYAQIQLATRVDCVDWDFFLSQESKHPLILSKYKRYKNSSCATVWNALVKSTLTTTTISVSNINSSKQHTVMVTPIVATISGNNTRSSAVAERPCGRLPLKHRKVAQWSLNVIENGTVRKLVCDFLFAFHSNYGRIFSRFDTTRI